MYTNSVITKYNSINSIIKQCNASSKILCYLLLTVLLNGVAVNMKLTLKSFPFDKINPWLLVSSLTFPWWLSNSPTFRVFSDKVVTLHIFTSLFLTMLRTVVQSCAVCLCESLFIVAVTGCFDLMFLTFFCQLCVCHFYDIAH